MKLKGMLKGAVSSLALVGMTACTPGSQSALQTSGSGIVGGTVVDAGDQIAQITAILFDDEHGALCTASILSDEWLLTAGHCVDGAKKESLLVLFTTDFQKTLGDLQSATTPEAKAAVREKIRRVADFTQNPGYAQAMAKIEILQKAADAQATTEGGALTPEETKKFNSDVDDVKDWGDLTLIHMQGKIPAGYHASNILASTYQFKKGDTITLAGYGMTSKADSASAGTLRQVDVTVSEPAWGTTEILFDQTNGKGACHGDSGGPAYVKNADGTLSLFGVTSRGVHDDSDSCVQFAAYSNVQFYRDWMKTVSGL